MMWGLRSSRTVVIAIAVLTFVLSCVLPPVYMLVSALVGNHGIRHTSTALLLDVRQRGLLYNTVILGVGTSVLATLVGAPLGFALARVALPFKTSMRLALAAPAILPTYVVALAWISLSAAWTYSFAGAIAVLSIVFYPLSMFASEVALRRVEPRLEEAALLAARPGRVLWRITLPLVAPSIGAAALVIFVLAISEFGVPGLLRVRVFTTEVFTAFAALYDFGRATVLALPLLILSIVTAAAGATVMGERIISTSRGFAGAPSLAFDAWKRPAVGAVACVIVGAVVLPLVVLTREALRAASIVGVVQGSRDAVLNSLLLAGLGATAVTAVAGCLAYARARATGKIGTAADVLMVVLFTVPSTVVGIGLIGLWNRPGGFGVLYGTAAMLLLAYVARFVPVAALALAATIRSVPVSHEEAAAVSGARWLPTMMRIVLPQIRLGLLAAWVISFILAFGEIGASILVAPPGESTLPIRVYTLIANPPSGHVAALALFQSVVILCPLILLGIVAATREPR